MTTPDLSRDALRRHVHDTDTAHRSARRLFRAALDRAFDPSSGTATEIKEALLGLPDRRRFLRIGGLTIASSALLVACSKDSSSPTSTPAADGPATDATLVLTSESIEQTAVAAYQKVIDSGLVKTATVVDVAKRFQQHHRDHAVLLAAMATQMGQQATGQPNAYLQQSVIDPAFKGMQDEARALAVLFIVEQAAAQTYTFSAGVLSVPPLRQAIMTMGGVEARHQAVIAHIQGEDPVPVPYQKTDRSVPKDAYVRPTAPVTPFPSTTSTTSTTAAAGGSTSTTG